MLRIESAPVALAKGASKVQDASAARTYAEHSVLASGRWAKIRVSETGVHQLTDAVIRKAGFNNLSKVKIYGYGGNLQPEALNASYLASTDDLKQVEQCIIDGKHLFEVGGKGKGFAQIKDLTDSYVVNDDVEIGVGNKIPLWLFGLLY